MLTKRAVLSPVDRADLAHCRHAAAAQPAQSIEQKSTQKSKKMCKFWGPFWGPFLDPKLGLRLAALLRILLMPDFEAHFWDLFWDPKLGPKIDQKTPKKNKHSEKIRPGGIQGFRKSDLQKPAKALGTHCKFNCMLLPPLLITCKELLQPALAVCM